MEPQVFFFAPDHSLATIVIYWAVFYVWFLSELFLGYRLTRSRRSASAVTRDSGSKWILIVSIWLGVGLGILLAIVVPSLGFQQHVRVLFIVGIVLALFGMALRWYSIGYLGRSFTCEVSTRHDQTVIRTGPYRLIRHPSYAGGLLTVFGLLLCLTNPIALLGLVLVAAGYGYRIAVEERVLTDQLGDSYRSYVRRTKRLIPFVL